MPLPSSERQKGKVSEFVAAAVKVVACCCLKRS